MNYIGNLLWGNIGCLVMLDSVSFSYMAQDAISGTSSLRSLFHSAVALPLLVPAIVKLVHNGILKKVE